MLPKGLLKEYSNALSMAIRVMDVFIVFLAGALSYFIRFDHFSLSSPYLYALLFGVLLSPFVFSFFDIYISVRGEGMIRHLFRLIQAISVLAFFLTSLSFFTKTGDSFSRTWFLIWLSLMFLLLIAFRLSLYFILRFMRAHGLNERQVIIIGASDLGIKLAETVQQALWTGFRIIAFMDDHASHKPAFIHEIPLIQTPAKLSEYFKERDVDEIWLALPLKEETRVKAILHELRHHTINTRFVLDIFGLDLLNHSITDVAGFPVLNIRSTPMVGVNRLIKAIEDRVVAAVILLFVSPLLLLIALGVKCSSRGPVFFKQHRLGLDGCVINIYKFRTMFIHHEPEGQLTQARPDDDRITPFGKWLRRTSLDELPQFINVLQGRMSIVGPRPHALEHNEFYKDMVHIYMQRHRVKPGITGWAQVNGWRGETDTLNKMQKRVEYDLFYINNWSLHFDLKIILFTLLKGFINRNAY